MNECKEERKEYDLVQIKGQFKSNITIDDTMNSFIRTNTSNLFGTNFAFIKRKPSVIKPKYSEFNAKYSLLRGITNLDENI